MVKKVFTDKSVKYLDEKSTVELIEFLESPHATPAKVNVINALMSKRLVRVIQDLTDSVKQGNEATSKQTKTLIWLTVVLVLLTLVLVYLTVVIVREA